MTHRQSTTRAGAHAAAARGFTLTEALVAVFAIALLSTGMAAIFASVGETVERGRRVSAINQYAGVIERQLRADIASMTREGFLVIRNEYAGGPQPFEARVPLSREVAGSERFRRIDELMFFARGSFESTRNPIDANLNIRANAARIYYGHGQKQLEGATGFFEPIFDDPNADPELRLGFPSNNLGGIGEANPNLYAADWTLLRHATLLVKPERSFNSQLNRTNPGATQIYDNELQLDFEPAADSVFRSLAFWGNPRPGVFDIGDDYDDWSLRGATAPPTFPSGVVDIATETLAEIKRRVTTIDLVESSFRGTSTAQVVLDTPAAVFSDPDRLPYFVSRRNNDVQFRLSPASFLAERRARAAGQANPNPLLGDAEALQTLVHQQHAWMWDAMPGASNEFTWASRRTPRLDPELLLVERLGTGPGGGANPTEPDYPFPTRMRYENTPPGYIAATFGAGAAGIDTSDPEDIVSRAAYAGPRADQQMVASSQFIPRCTEFIVEFSFGERSTALLEDQLGVPEGELIWYGHRRIGNEGLAVPLRPGTLPETRPDGNRPGDPPDNDNNEFTPPAFPNPLLNNNGEDQRLLERHLLADLVIGTPDGVTDRDRYNVPFQYPVTYFFGYADPRAQPTQLDVIPADLNGDGQIDEGEGFPNRGFDVNGDGYRDDLDGDGVYDDAWPWPKLLRVTMTFADPVDQTTEETFQLVFEVPQGGGL